MSNTLSFDDESLERSIRRRAEYDDDAPGDLILSVAKRAGGTIKLPLLSRARSNVEREEYQENTLLRIKPLAEIVSNLPVLSGGLTFHTGRGVALLRPGFLYVFRGASLWRELEIDPAGLMSDIDLPSMRLAQNESENTGSVRRDSEGEWLSDILVPVLLQGQAVINEVRIAYSEVQWDWQYICRLEADDGARRARTSGIDHAWPAATVDELTFEKGYPAANIKHVDGLRSRDLGIELMLETPSDFSPAFEAPGEDELCTRLKRKLEHIARENTQDTDGMELSVQPETDRLADLRDQKGLVCVSIPDPLFSLRNSLARLHLALHYLDAVDESIQQNPMVHSAMLIRQAVFDPLVLNGENRLQKYADVIDREKLDQVLETGEKQSAVAVIDRHVAQLTALMQSLTLAAVLDDFRACSDLAICEGYLLIADTLNVLQQIPGVLRANGVASDGALLVSLKQWVMDSEFLTAWAPQPVEDIGDRGASPSQFQSLQKLAEDRSEITEDQLDRLNLQSLAYLEKQLQDRQDDTGSIAKGISDGGKVGALFARSLEEWSTAVLTVCKRLIEEGAVRQIEIQRVMQSAVSNFVLADPDLEGIDIVSRGGVDSSGTILGVQGEGLQRGLTEFDRTEGVLTRKNDYLYADLVDGHGELQGSTSPARASDELETALKKMAGPAMVFYAPAGHSEAAKLSLIKVDFAKRVSASVDGPAVSRGLVVLAAFNVFVEFRTLMDGLNSDDEKWPLMASKVSGASVDLTAASLKLSQVLGEMGSSKAGGPRAYRLAVRPLFDVKNWLFIGTRLQRLGAQTLVRTVSLASFMAGALGVGLSYWEMRLSLADKDFDAATGHAVALTGGMIFLAHPVMASLLAIPGWGWAVLGMGMIIGGGLYAASSTDDHFEQLLKRGPWGIYPEESAGTKGHKAYYSQLLALLAPISVSVQSYADIDPDLALINPDHPPVPEDYVVTIDTAFASRFQLYRDQSPALPEKPFNLVVQEVAYASSTMETYGAAGAVRSIQFRNSTPLRKVVARQSLPHRSAVRFLVKRDLQDTQYESWGYQETVSTRLRVGLQAVIDTELGPMVFPGPVYKHYEPFELSRHGIPPAKEISALDPFSQPASPYWFFTEVEV
ncbi:toxin VasX [Marinobacter sp. F4206]|uniref:toxin VasX n=1 Tax=Marinobacter sp. F4206 TaxID=2861777 RepID=UPI001C5EF2B2|nr:toxin VasX [Marinobacter sp. F4206]MBW4936086.1 hypothetical protein [Marinobacter sp. F4206]